MFSRGKKLIEQKYPVFSHGVFLYLICIFIFSDILRFDRSEKTKPEACTKVRFIPTFPPIKTFVSVANSNEQTGS